MSKSIMQDLAADLKRAKHQAKMKEQAAEKKKRKEGK